MTFTLTINTDNDSFGECDEQRLSEIARLLGHVSDRLRCGWQEGRIRDSNGNTCGEFSLEAT